MGSTFEVQGAFAKIAPRRHCQVANGLAYSANSQRQRTDSCKAPVDGPLAGPAALKEGLGDQVSLALW